MLVETTSKGMVYGLNSFTIVDKKSGEEKGLIDIYYIYPNSVDNAHRVGWTNGHTFVAFSDKIWNGLKDILLKQCEIKFKLEPDFKDSTRYSSRLVSVNDIVIKQ